MKKMIKQNWMRIVIYFLLVVILLVAGCVVNHFNTEAKEVVAKGQHQNQTITAWQALQQKKSDYLAKGVDTSGLDDQLKSINDAIYNTNDYGKADQLISDANTRLDKLLADYQASVAASEAKKGDLLGNVTCGGSKCSAAATLKLTNSGGTVATTSSDGSGNYLFRENAGSYGLSASASGFITLYKSAVDIVSQKQNVVNFDLKKTAPVQKSSGTSGGASGGGGSGPIAMELNLINDYRAANGLSQLSLDPALNNAAAGHSAWMSSTGTVSHTGDNGSTPWDRCSAAGTSCGGEILYMGSTDPNKAFSGWKNSPPHNAIMLGNFSAIGIGISGTYWTADFR